MEAPGGLEPPIEILQTSALPLGDGAARTRADRRHGLPGRAGRLLERTAQQVLQQPVLETRVFLDQQHPDRFITNQQVVLERVILQITLGSEGIHLDTIIVLACFRWPEGKPHPLARLLPGDDPLPFCQQLGEVGVVDAAVPFLSCSYHALADRPRCRV